MTHHQRPTTDDDMLDDWFSLIKLPLSLRQFHRLPENPAYKYEYINRTAWLSPRPKLYHARLELIGRKTDLVDAGDAPEGVSIRRLEDGDWPHLSRPFAGSFRRVQPFASLTDRRRLAAARDCLAFTRGGGDGPIVHPACHVAWGGKHPHPIGAILVTLIPPVALDDLWSLRWEAPPPPDGVERRTGHAHLTWVFVGPMHAGYGVGTALLAHAVRGLVELGYTQLVTSFILGNDSSMLWHWRNGFELLPYSGSRRKFREMIKASLSQDLSHGAGTGRESLSDPDTVIS